MLASDDMVYGELNCWIANLGNTTILAGVQSPFANGLGEKFVHVGLDLGPSLECLSGARMEQSKDVPDPNKFHEFSPFLF